MKNYLHKKILPCSGILNFNKCFYTSDVKGNQYNTILLNKKKKPSLQGRKINEYFRNEGKNEEIDWDRKDTFDMKRRNFMFSQNKLYIRLMLKWQSTLFRRQRNKLRTKQNFEKYVIFYFRKNLNQIKSYLSLIN